MKTSKMALLGFFLVLFGSAVILSCKDDFTEEDLVNAQGRDSVQLSIVVFNGSTSSILKSGKPTSSDRKRETQGLSGLTVTITNAKGQLITKTTDANGLAVFRALEPGSVAGVVSGTDFTTTNFVVSIRNTSENDPFTSAGVIIPVFEIAGPNTATVTGTVTAELDLLNNTRENVPDGTRVSFTIFQPELSSDAATLEFLTAIFGESASTIALQNADVTSLSFEGNFTASTTGGVFTATLPTSPDGLAYEVEFSDFQANQSIAINNFENELGGSVRDVQSISTLFSQSSDFVFASGTRIDIPILNGVQFDVEAPPAQGSGAAITAALVPQAVATGGFAILAGGSGYPVSSTTIAVTVTGGDFDGSVPGATAAALTATSDANGEIIGIGGTLGFGYRSQATVTVNSPGSGAVIRVNYTSTLPDPGGFGVNSGVTISNGGTGYFVAPNVQFRGFDQVGNAVEGNATGEVVNGGILVNFASPGTGFAQLSGPPIVQPAARANAAIFDYNIDANGTLTAITSTNIGAGYNSVAPPAVTVRDLRTPGGSGAQIYASTNGGTIDAFVITSGGTGYSIVDANYPSSFEQFRFATDNSNGFTEDVETTVVLRPGITKILNAHYGTGIRSRGVN